MKSIVHLGALADAFENKKKKKKGNRLTCLPETKASLLPGKESERGVGISQEGSWVRTQGKQTKLDFFQ